MHERVSGVHTQVMVEVQRGKPVKLVILNFYHADKVLRLFTLNHRKGIHEKA